MSEDNDHTPPKLPALVEDDVSPPLAQRPSAEGEDPAQSFSKDSIPAQPVEGTTAFPKLSAVVLFHNEYDTLEHTLQSWQNFDLPTYLSDVVFFLNGVKSGDEFSSRLPILSKSPWKGMVRVVPSAENLKLGLAINRMVELAKEENVLLLEKDWALIEPTEVVRDTLAAATRLLDEGAANVVRFRHRERPGAPLHARIMHENREKQMLAQQSNLYCYMHHWIKDPLEKYGEFFSRCSNRTGDVGTWCVKAKYCQWTNNPALFKKSWFLKELGEKFAQTYKETIDKDPNSHMLDFEFFTNWKTEVWNDRDFVVALPKGLFEHQEVGEQNVQNTVWYGWMRLNTDVEEKRNALFESEKLQCKDTTKKLDSGPKFKDKYPVEFARLYHYNRAMERTADEAVDELQKTCIAMREQIERGEGTWRNGITTLTDLYYKTVLFAYPMEPEDMDIAFVTSLYNSEGGEEPGDADVDLLCANLDFMCNYKKVVYCTAETQARVEAKLRDKFSWDNGQVKSITFSARPVDDMLDALLGNENIERVNKLHADENWTSTVRERGDLVPSAKALSLTMAKPYMLRSALDLLPATHYVSFDGLSRCMSGENDGIRLTRDSDVVLRGNLLLSAFMTGVTTRTPEERKIALEGSGFVDENLSREMELKDGDGLPLADFKTLGGSRLGVAMMTGYYDVTLRDLLRRGNLGTGREAMSIARKNVEYHFRFFDGAGGCRNGDEGCVGEPVAEGYMKEQAEVGCRLWRWTRSCVAGEG